MGGHLDGGTKVLLIRPHCGPQQLGYQAGHLWVTMGCHLARKTQYPTCFLFLNLLY